MLTGGIGALLIAVLSREGVNESGFVPLIGLGYLLISLAGLTFIGAAPPERGRHWRIVVVIVLAAWLGASTYVVLSTAPGMLGDAPVGTMIGIVVVMGFLVTQGAVVLFGVVALLIAAAWLADRIPVLRRHTIGDQLRRHALPWWARK
jgi:hypothetical protein